MKFRPCIDLHEGKVKQIVGGTLVAGGKGITENYVSTHDSAYYADRYKRDQLDGGHVIMLGPGNESAALLALERYPGGFQIGGGINLQNARHYLDHGASHVIVTSFVFRDGLIDFTALEQISSLVGRRRLVLDLSCRRQGDKFFVVTDRWQTFTRYTVNPENLALLSRYCDEFLIHAADVEGLCSGVEDALLPIIAASQEIPVTYAGGISGWEDIQKIRDLGRGQIDFTIGSALDIFGGAMKYASVLAWLKEQNTEQESHS